MKTALSSILICLALFFTSCQRSDVANNQNTNLSPSPSSSAKPEQAKASTGNNLAADFPEGDYQFIAVRSENKCLDVRTNNDRMQIFGCGHPDKKNQRFKVVSLGGDVYQITLRKEWCLDVARHNNNPDQILEVQPCNSSENYQKWRITQSANDWFQMRNVESNQCMSVRDISGGDETWVVQNNCGDPENKAMWKRRPLP